MHRPTVGILALLLSAVGLVMLALPGTSDEIAARSSAAAPFLRVGLLLGVMWLALPDLQRPLSRAVVVALLIAVFVFARRPQLFVLALVALAALALLSPRLRAITSRQR